jgi:hypothetical protein
MLPPRTPGSDDGLYSRRGSRDSGVSERRNSDVGIRSNSGRSRKSRWSDSDSSVVSDDSSRSRGTPTRKGSIKSRLGLPAKKKNEPTGLTITLSRSKEEENGIEKKRKRSYETMDSDSDTSEV